MGWLLDTNVVRGLRRTSLLDGGDPAFRRWAARRPAGVDHISVVTMIELELSVRTLEQRDRARGMEARRWYDDQVLPEFDGRVLAVDAPVAQAAAALNGPDRDTLIAATASVHGLGIATRNVRAFAPYSLRVFNPWVG